MLYLFLLEAELHLHLHELLLLLLDDKLLLHQCRLQLHLSHGPMLSLLVSSNGSKRSLSACKVFSKLLAGNGSILFLPELDLSFGAHMAVKTFAPILAATCSPKPGARLAFPIRMELRSHRAKVIAQGGLHFTLALRAVGMLSQPARAIIC